MSTSRFQQDLDEIIGRALREDVGSGDVTTIATIPESRLATGRLIAKGSGTISGLGPASRVFELVDGNLTLDWQVTDGESVTPGQPIGEVAGSARSILTAERTALNILQRMSGIATLTSKMAAAAHPHPARILDTRKTVPGLRLLDKMAVRHGGGLNHRVGLYDMILIKDNHIASSGSIHAALTAADAYRRQHGERSLEIEIEARTLDEVRLVMHHWETTGMPDRILLDNMVTVDDGVIDVSRLTEAVEMVGARIKTEASGNVNLSTVGAIAATGVDYISSGALTHSVEALDISLIFALEP